MGYREHWNARERQALRDDVARLASRPGSGIAICSNRQGVLGAVAFGLKAARPHRYHLGRDESRYLEPLERIIESGRSPAEEMLEKFDGAWNRSVEPAYDEYAF